jgi:hypothetical protein
VLLALCWEWPAVSLPCPPIGYKGIVFHQSRAFIFAAHLLTFLLIVGIKITSRYEIRSKFSLKKKLLLYFLFYICFKLVLLWWKADIY